MKTNLAVLCGLAANPVTPEQLLVRLAALPDGGLLGPTVALLEREHLPAPVAEALLRHPHPEIRRRLAGHRPLPARVLLILAEDPEAIVRAQAAASFTITGAADQASSENVVDPSTADVLGRLARDVSPQVRAEIARNHGVPADIRATLVEDPDPEVRRCVALRALPDAALYRLMHDSAAQVRQTALMTAVVCSPHARFPQDLFDRFAAGSAYTRQSAATLVILTPALLDRLWAQPDLRGGLAANTSLPVEQMRACLADADLAAELAGNPALPAALLDELVDTGWPQVHRELLERVDLPPRLLRRLVEADERRWPMPLVSSLLPEHASLAERLSYLDHPHRAFRRTLAFSSDLPADAVARLATDSDFSTRLLICERYRDVPPQALVEVLARWKGHSREKLLRHPALPTAAMAGYAAGDSPRDRAAVASRPDAPVEVLQRLLADPVLHVRTAAAANPALPDEALQRLLTDPDATLREAAASNPALPVEQLERLFADGLG
ncbi:hypothetical protein [Catellatospora sp. TT07R-123]|uniref:hypothetical protein n=1 Tax=Catellatospora sp. TT07R-123 TaxID=2733863 RepID=UPI001BB3AAD3|nr:hypothetical protein [Catellatospora sp. TT07R-123]